MSDHHATARATYHAALQGEAQRLLYQGDQGSQEDVFTEAIAAALATVERETLDRAADAVTDIEIRVTSDDRHFAHEKNGARMVGACFREWHRKQRAKETR